MENYYVFDKIAEDCAHHSRGQGAGMSHVSQQFLKIEGCNKILLHFRKRF